jgi:DNA-binding transcriptional MerR regulator
MRTKSAEPTATEKALAATGISYRRLDFWASKGYLRPEGGGGSGRARRWPEAELQVGARMGVYVDRGLTPAVAEYAARNNGQLPGGGRIVLEDDMAGVAA